MTEFLAGKRSSQTIRYIKLANTWLILNSGGGPTPDKPEVLLETPSDLNLCIIRRCKEYRGAPLRSARCC